MKKTNQKGFTLSELLIVVAIIAVLVAIAVPIFSAQLEKSRDAVTIANLRTAYAEASAKYLTDDSNKTVPIDVESKGTQTGWADDIDQNLPFTLKNNASYGDMSGDPNTYTVTFNFESKDKCTATYTPSEGNANSGIGGGNSLNEEDDPANNNENDEGPLQ